MKSYVVFQWYLEENLEIECKICKTEKEANALCDALEKRRKPGTSYYYRYREVKNETC